MITLTQFTKLFPKAKTPQGWVDAIEHHCQPRINSALKLSHFLAQVSHESGGFTQLEENLNYSAKRLLEVFPKYFTTETASAAAHNPELIGNTVYANRMGNTAKGSGYKFRGRGIIQLTGYNNYRAASVALNFDDPSKYVDNPDLLLIPDTAVKVAIWYWNTNNLSMLAAAGRISDITRCINGGLNGLAERKSELKRISAVIM